jgi:hypothetical protein
MAKFRLFGEISKVDEQPDGTLLVYGVASTPAKDSDGEVITAEAMKGAIPEYMEKRRAVREMHQSIAAGVTKALTVDDDGKTHIIAHIVDPVTVKKVQTGVLKQWSVGGKAIKRDPQDLSKIDKLWLREVSLVDIGANGGSDVEGFEVCKLDGDPDAAIVLSTSAVDELKKYDGCEAYDAQTAINCITSLQGLLNVESGEDEPPEQAEAIKAALEKLKQFVASEILEKPTDEAAKAAKASGGADELAKAGATHSAETKKKLKEAADHLKAAHDSLSGMIGDDGASDGDTKKVDSGAQTEDAIAKVAGLTDELTKAQTELTSTKTERDELKGELAKAEGAAKVFKDELFKRGVLKAVDKGTDGAGIEKAQTDEGANTKDPLELVKVAQRNGVIIPRR